MTGRSEASAEVGTALSVTLAQTARKAKIPAMHAANLRVCLLNFISITPGQIVYLFIRYEQVPGNMTRATLNKAQRKQNQTREHAFV